MLPKILNNRPILPRTRPQNKAGLRGRSTFDFARAYLTRCKYRPMGWCQP